MKEYDVYTITAELFTTGYFENKESAIKAFIDKYPGRYFQNIQVVEVVRVKKIREEGK